jgi:hypothetical protein
MSVIEDGGVLSPVLKWVNENQNTALILMSVIGACIVFLVIFSCILGAFLGHDKVQTYRHTHHRNSRGYSDEKLLNGDNEEAED